MHMSKCLMIKNNVPKKFWAKDANTVVYLLNLLPTQAVNDMTPFEAWFGYKSSLNHLKVFGGTRSTDDIYHRSFVVAKSQLLLQKQQNVLNEELLYIKYAFLIGVMEEEIYVEQPDGFIQNTNEDKIFVKSCNEATLYIYSSSAKPSMIVSLYVVDLLVIEEDNITLQRFKEKMHNEFDMTDVSLSRYSDSDWAGNVDDLRNLSGCVFTLAISKNLVFHGKSKHIQVKFHAIRDAEKNGDIHVQYFSSELQLTDIMTKALLGPGLEYLRSKLNIYHAGIKEEC
ncbi:Uncharacterized protein TCM_012898 [Theobroma cacao]|uniref:Cysteine-rich RLK (RECEPTOR-like protein kinase) 8 n=1 Tax=Theobroma cacao TaxID=3641 RepID=A0A061G2V3_THECC|nr:Uncharacterized protein TCM_012898 [Theobroma cacao]